MPQPVLDALPLDPALQADQAWRHAAGAAVHRLARGRVQPAALGRQDVALDEQGGRGSAREAQVQPDRDERAVQRAREDVPARLVDGRAGPAEAGERRPVREMVREDEGRDGEETRVV